MYHNFIEMNQSHVSYIYLFGMVYSNACTKQDSRHRWPAKTLDASLVWLWTDVIEVV